LKRTNAACFLRWWTARLLFCVNDLPHNVQLYGFSPVGILICWLSWLLCANDLPHKVQLYDFSPEWTLRCMSSCLFLPEVLLHCWQLNNLVFLTACILCSIMLSICALLIPIFDNTYYFSMNYSNVDCQTAFLCKWFATQCATVWLFTRMNSHMLIKKAALCKQFATQCTFVWSFIYVHSHMLTKLVPLCKQFATQSATVWFFTCMNSHMPVKITFGDKYFTALLTAQQFSLFDSGYILCNCVVSYCIITVTFIPENIYFFNIF
jgi:hypothetical protein